MDWLTTQRVAFGSVSVSYASLLVAIGVLLVGFILASNVAARIRRFGNPGPEAARWRATLGQVVAYALRVLAVAVALQVTGVQIATVLAAGAVVAVGIGIAMQKVAENFVSGVILIAERSIREGDILEFDGRVAKVRHMGIRATIAVTLDDEELIVPNSILTQSMVKNLTLTESHYRLRVRVGVSYSTDVDHAAEVLRAAAESVAWREQTHAPVVLFTEFGTSSIDFDVSVWTNDVWGMRRGQSDLRKALWRGLRDAGITIPFPQLDVHFDAAPERAEE